MMGIINISESQRKVLADQSLLNIQSFRRNDPMSTNIYSDNYRQNLINHMHQFDPSWSIPDGYHVHHIIPQCLGGTHDPSNLIALHPDDHISVHKLRGDKISDNFFLVTKNIYGENNPFYGKKHTEETKLAISKSKKGRCGGEKHPLWGKKHSAESKEKNRQSNLGKKHTEETKIKMRKPHRKHKIITCPHCDKEGHDNVMYRWHFGNCRNRNDK